MHRLLTEGIASGEVVPLPLNRFSRKEAGNAFRFMAAGGCSLQDTFKIRLIEIICKGRSTPVQQ